MLTWHLPTLNIMDDWLIIRKLATNIIVTATKAAEEATDRNIRNVLKIK